MIDSHILKVMQKSCPNYHIVAQSAQKASSVCLCARCLRHIRKEGATHCGELFDRLVQMDYPIGYSRVDIGATCDRAVDPQMPLPLDAPPGDKGGEVFP